VIKMVSRHETILATQEERKKKPVKKQVKKEETPKKVETPKKSKLSECYSTNIRLFVCWL